MPPDGVRRAGLSAFGFGGTNFHAVLEEYIPRRLNGNGKRSVAVSEMPPQVKEPASPMMNRKDASANFNSSQYKAPLRGALVIGAASEAALVERLRAVEKDAKAGRAPAPAAPAESDLRAPERVAIDYAQRHRTGGQSRQRTQSAGGQSAGNVESPARARHLPRSRSRSQGCVPVHRPRFAVREHAASRCAQPSRLWPKLLPKPIA